MADLARVKRNISRMISMNAPEEDIDAYISSEGTSIDAVRAFKLDSPAPTRPGIAADDPRMGYIAAAKARVAAGEAAPEVDLTAEELRDPSTRQAIPDGPMARMGAFSVGAVDGLPIVGPALMAGVKGAAAGARALTSDDSFSDAYGRAGGTAEAIEEQYPTTSLVGGVTGNLLALGGLGATGVGARALGLSQTGLAARMGASAASGSAIAGADTAVRGGNLTDVASSAATGGLLGAAVPAVGYGISKAYRAGADAIGSRLRGAYNPERVAGEKLGKAIAADRSNAAHDVLGAADNATAALNSQPLMNIDRGGENTRALARVAANADPDARAAISKLADERFVTQGGRTEDFVKRIMGGNVDDLALQDRIKDIARITNRKAYAAAENSPAAQAVWDDDLAQLMQSPAVQNAARNATTRSADRVAVEGGQAVKNPFTFAKGQARLARQPDGSTAIPSLRFWDQVKRNLDSDIGKAQRGGDNTRAADLTSIKRRLTDKLDGLVPEYQMARRGAAAAFGAEDAVEAGKIFARQTRNVPEMDRAIAKLSAAEKKGFEVGYASELLDKIRSTNDRVSAVRMFKSPEMRAKMDLALGPQKTKELESFIRVEDAMDKVRGALGNSTTARQLIEAGAIGGLGGGASLLTGDPKYFAIAATGALARAALKGAGSKIDERVMKKVAEMLVSDDPKIIEKAVRQSAFSPQYLAAVDALGKAAGIAGRVAVAQPGQ